MSELSAAAGVNYDGPFDTLFSCAPSPAAAYTAAMALTELHKSERLGASPRGADTSLRRRVRARSPHDGVQTGRKSYKKRLVCLSLLWPRAQTKTSALGRNTQQERV